MNVSFDSEPRTAPARSRSETRRRLLEAATDLFARGGLHGATSHDIARAAGVAAGTFYLHFRDKTVLFRELADEAIARLVGRMEEANSGAESPADAVRRRAEALLTFAEENRGLVQILFGHEREAASVGADVLARLSDMVAAGIRQRRDAGLAPSDLHPEVAAQALVGLRARVAAWWAEEPGRAPREQVIATLVRLELSGAHLGAIAQPAPCRTPVDPVPVPTPPRSARACVASRPRSAPVAAKEPSR